MRQYCSEHMKMDRNVVVTGIGLVTDKGCEQDIIWGNLYYSNYESTLEKDCGMICGSDFKKRFPDITLCSTYGFSAAELAWKDAFELRDDNFAGGNWGVFNGTAFGSFTNTVNDICREYVKNGPGGLLPGIFNNKSCNVTADIISICHKLTGVNNTYMSGRLASGMAMMQAYDDIKDFGLHGAVVVGTEAIDPFIVKGHGLLGVEETASFASGAGSVVLQALEDTGTGPVVPQAYIRAVEVAGGAGKTGQASHHLWKSLIRAMSTALDNAGIGAGEIDLIVSGQGMSGIEKLCYKKAYGKIFGDSYNSKVFNTKEAAGDFIGALPVINTVFGIMLIGRQSIPYKDRDDARSIRYAMITAGDTDGSAWALILERCR